VNISWPGVQQRVLVIRADGAEIYSVRGSSTIMNAAFTADEMDLFQSYCHSRRDSQFTVLVDIVEEDFQQESMPFVSGRNRRALLARKFDQLFRATPYRAAASLGRESGEERSGSRRDENVLFMALTNHQCVTPWLEILHTENVQVKAVLSLPAASQWLVSRLKLRGRSAMVVALTRAGLRQIYLENGQLRFARLAPMVVNDFAEVGLRMAGEIERTHQYLASLRWMAREQGPLPVVLLCPPGLRDAWRISCNDTDRLAYEFIDFDSITAGLISQKRNDTDEGLVYADALWAAGAVRKKPDLNFAPDWSREHHHTWLWRTGIVAAGAAISAAGGIAGAVLLGQAKNIDVAADRHAANSSRANNQYQDIAKTFPRTLTTPEHLKGAVLALDPLVMRPLTPEILLLEISQALLEAPTFTLSKIEWEVTELAETSPPGVPGQPSPPPVAPGGKPATARYEIAVLSGALSQERSATPRRKIVAARSAIDALRRIPGVEVTPVKLPLDVAPTGTLKGGDTDDVKEEVEPIIVRVARKAPI